MTRYKDFRTEDFIKDESFIRWVKSPEREIDDFWQKFMDENPGKLSDIQEAKNFILGVQANSLKPSSEFLQEQLKVLHSKIDSQTNSSAHSLSLWPQILKAAAVLLLMVGIYWLWQNYFPGTASNHYSTSFAEIKELQLPDGTKVSLNANSELERLGDWDTDNYRRVKLKGEAFFDVVSSQAADGKAFVIETEYGEVEVVGTKFNLNSRKTKFKLLLAEGKVKFQSNAQNKETQSIEPLLLTAGELLILQDAVFKPLKVENSLPFTSWKDGKYIFEETPLFEVAELFKDNFGYTISFDGATTAERKISGTFPNQDPLHLLGAIEQAMQLKKKSLGEKAFQLEDKR